MGERRGIYRVLVEKPEGMRPLGRPWHRLKLAKSLRFKDRTVCSRVSWSFTTSQLAILDVRSPTVLGSAIGGNGKWL